MPDNQDIELDQEALERAISQFYICLQGGPNDEKNALAYAIRAYLAAIHYPQQRAVVEAAVRYKTASKVHTKALYDWYAGLASPICATEDALEAARNSYEAAVAALEDRTDG